MDKAGDQYRISLDFTEPGYVSPGANTLAIVFGSPTPPSQSIAATYTPPSADSIAFDLSGTRDTLIGNPVPEYLLSFGLGSSGFPTYELRAHTLSPVFQMAAHYTPGIIWEPTFHGNVNLRFRNKLADIQQAPVDLEFYFVDVYVPPNSFQLNLGANNYRPELRMAVHYTAERSTYSFNASTPAPTLGLGVDYLGYSLRTFEVSIASPKPAFAMAVGWQGFPPRFFTVSVSSPAPTLSVAARYDNRVWRGISRNPSFSHQEAIKLNYSFDSFWDVSEELYLFHPHPAQDATTISRDWRAPYEYMEVVPQFKRIPSEEGIPVKRETVYRAEQGIPNPIFRDLRYTASIPTHGDPNYVSSEQGIPIPWEQGQPYGEGVPIKREILTPWDLAKIFCNVKRRIPWEEASELRTNKGEWDTLPRERMPWVDTNNPPYKPDPGNIEFLCKLVTEIKTIQKVDELFDVLYVAPTADDINFDLDGDTQTSEGLVNFLPIQVTIEVQRLVASGGLIATMRFGPYNCRGINLPNAGVYIVENEFLLMRADDNTPIEVISAEISSDVDSWAWSFTATLPPTEFPKIAPGVGGPVEVELHINGIAWRVLVETYGNRTQFGEAAITITGRSVTAYMDKPYAPTNSRSFTQDIAARQVAQDAIDTVTMQSGFDMNWTLIPNDTTDWLMPAGFWSYSDLSPIGVITSLVDGVKGYVNSDPLLRRFIIGSRYPHGPYWNWGSATPDAVIPRSLILLESLSWEEQPTWDAVYVAGEDLGVTAFVKRLGFAGALTPEMHVSPFITTEPAAREAGTAIISAGGKQATVELSLPMLPGIRDIRVSDLIEVNNLGVELDWRGMVRGVNISVKWDSDQGLEVLETIEVERHY